MRHVYECPMRWADLDMLGHVNNVVYVDYLQEARVDMMRTHGRSEGTDELAEGVVVVRHEVTYRAPLTFRLRPVKIESWITEIRVASFTMAYEVFHDDPDSEGGRRVYLRATTLLTPYVFSSESPRRLRPEEKATLAEFLERPEERPERPTKIAVRRGEVGETGHFPVQVRFSDVDVYRHVNNVLYFEYFQEARIRLHSAVTRGLDDLPDVHMVVAQTDVDYVAPIVFRAEPYDCWSQYARIGHRSMTIESEICDGDRVLSRARVAMVFFDPGTGRSTEPPPAYRARLLAAVSDTGFRDGC